MDHQSLATPASVRTALRAGGLLALVLVVSRASVHLRPTPDSVATWWPAAGLAIAVLLVAPRRWWWALVPGVLAVTMLANHLGGRSDPVSAALAVGNAAEALVGALVLQGRRRTTPRLTDPAGYLRLLVAAALGAATVAVVSEAALAVVGAPAWRTAPVVLPSHLAATLVVLPLLLLPHRGSERRGPETVLQTCLLAVTVAVSTSSLLDEAVASLFVVMPLLIWAALRLPALVAALQVAAVGVVVTVSTARGAGAFADVAATSSFDAGGSLRAYLVCLALLALPTALAAEQRRRLVERLGAERELSATTLDTTAAIIVVTTPEGRIERVNAALERLTGWTADDVVGRWFWDCDLIPDERREIVRGLYADVPGGTVPATREADVISAVGDRLRVVWSNNVVTDAAGAVQHVVCTASDVTSERASTRLVEHLLDSPKAAPMLSLDEELRITVCNAASEALFGVHAEEVLGERFVRLVCPEQHEHMEAALSRASTRSRETRTAAVLDHEWSWLRPDGTVVRLGATVSAVLDPVGRQVGTLVVASDTTRQRAQEEALQRALETERRAVERLRRLDTAKNEFVSTVSHELRTPTTSIVGYTEMLRDEVAGEVTAQQRELLDVITRNGMRLIAVANDLLTLAGLESQDRSTWSAAGVDLTTVVAQAEETVVPLVAGRDLEVVFTAPTAGVPVRGDAAHLDRVVVNLLSNAVKFTPDGGRVSCSLRSTPTEAVLEVADTGIGIPLEEQADLFSKFFRSSTAQHHAIPGTGLGLSIIHRIVDDHGGRIDVRSADGAGTTFTVHLPLAPAAAPSTTATAAAVSAG